MRIKILKKIKTARRFRKALHYRRTFKNFFCRKRIRVVSVTHNFNLITTFSILMAAVAAGIGALVAAVSAGTSIANSVTEAKARAAQARNNDPFRQAKAAENANLDYMGQMDKRLQGLGMPAGIAYMNGAKAPGERAINGLNFRFSNYEALPQSQSQNMTSQLAYQYGLEGFTHFRNAKGGDGTEEFMETEL